MSQKSVFILIMYLMYDDILSYDIIFDIIRHEQDRKTIGKVKKRNYFSAGFKNALGSFWVVTCETKGFP